ncbi:hypothetical protein ACHQM5_009941 [Ranunculus cassubicifolius]
MPSARHHLHRISLGLSPRGFIFSRVCINFRYSFNHKSQSDSDPPSPSEFLLSATSRKTLIYLILTLNHMYPDYDFSSFLESLYKALDEVVKLGEFEMYSYSPDSDGDPFSEKGALWSFKSKRYRALCATIKHICNGG